VAVEAAALRPASGEAAGSAIVGLLALVAAG
jgi:hypothetical protein